MTYGLYLEALNNQRKRLEKCYEYMRDEDDLYWELYCEEYDKVYDDKQYDFAYPIVYNLCMENEFFDFINCD